jgi:anti-sigma regulatory factor (Ser/Thr protein kinase)
MMVDAAPTAAREARRAVARRRFVGAAQEATLLLLVSELVSNSVRHAGLRRDERIRLRARREERVAYVEVCDAGRSGRIPAKREDGLDALEPGGLGLVLVDEMADRWGVACSGDETCVWFELGCG